MFKNNKESTTLHHHYYNVEKHKILKKDISLKSLFSFNLTLSGLGCTSTHKVMYINE